MKKIYDGNKALAYVAYNFIESCGIYPITPSSTMSEEIERLSKIEKKNNFFDQKVELYEMQSEAGAIALCHGMMQNGVLCSTFTSSQGLLLMIPTMYKMAGEKLPFVMNVATRTIATHSLSIFGDHQDIYAARTTGFSIFVNSSVQEVMDQTGAIYNTAMRLSLPFINAFDGFRTSHELQKIEEIDLEKLKNTRDLNLINKFKSRAIQNNVHTRGSNLNDNLFFEISEAGNIYYQNVEKVVEEELQKINEITGKNYHIMNYHGSLTAKKVIVAMGSVCETIKEYIDGMSDLGLVEIHLFRPFSIEYLKQILPSSVEKIAVLDRAKEPVNRGVLYTDVLTALNKTNIQIVGGIYGLSSKDTRPEHIKAIFEMLDDPKDDFTVGINDDVTNKSLEINDCYVENKHNELLIYGFGSDGMVSASKNLIKLLDTPYVQAYFEYDSKKAGGLTKSHIRYSDNEIKSPYYVNSPKIVVVTKISYLKKYRIIENMREDSILLLNTFYTDQELNDCFTDEAKKMLIDQNVTIYKINASKIAIDHNLRDKINNVMLSALIKILNIDVDNKIKELKDLIVKQFKNNIDLITINHQMIDASINSIELVDRSNFTLKDIHLSNELNAIISSKRSEVKVSDVLKYANGSFQGGESYKEKRDIAYIVPSFIKENCISCNQCSAICPHGVIRPFLLDDKEYNSAPEYVKKYLIPTIVPPNKYYYGIAVSIKDCTGCGLCFDTCPGKLLKKALKMTERSELDEDYIAYNEYLFNNISDKEIPNKYLLRNSQFISPKFAFSGACSGCGEAAYLKLLTQIFKDELVIANATGCSSIYGGEVPYTSYDIPWINSLFEDNAELAMGLQLADGIKKKNILNYLITNKEKFKIYPEIESYINKYDYNSSRELYNIIDDIQDPYLIANKEDVLIKTFFSVGGDGWAYDIGYSGIDHVLASNADVNLVVLDTESYSNTGGQNSKSSNLGTINKFAITGKDTNKKDLARLALVYDNVYVAQVSLAANMNATIQAFKEAREHKGPSLIICYSPCIEHKINGGLKTVAQEILAAESGYFPIFRYNPNTKTLKFDKKVDFNKYEEFINNEKRFTNLYNINKDANELLNKNKEMAIKKYNFLKYLENKNEEEGIL